MVKLNQRGDIAVVEFIIYIPVLVLAIILVLRHGFTRRVGWIFLVILSLVRIAGAITNIASEENPSNTTLQIVYSTLEAAGISPLLLATLGFLQTVSQDTLDSEPIISRGLKAMGILAIVALALSITGGVNEGNATTQSALNSGENDRHIGAILFAVLFGLIFLLHIYCWMNRGRILRHRQTLLTGITCAIPFLAVRIAYTMLSAYAPLDYRIDSDGQTTYVPNTSVLAKFGLTGSWVVYLLMSVVPEYITVLIYLFMGTRIPLQKDTDYVMGPTSQGWNNANAEAARLPSYDSAYAP